MKIGIMTYPLQGNYGAILQNYALQAFLKDNGHKPTTIQWETEFNSWTNYLRGLYHLLKSWRNNSHHIWPTLPGHYRVYQENGGRRKFVKRNIDLSKACLIENLTGLVISTEFDAMIVGSDQVWRPSFIPNIDIMFFSFAKGLNVKKIAYAASFGVSYNDFSESQLNECRSLVSEFDAVSVREDSAIDQCSELLGYHHATWVPDPTFLIPVKRYLDCCKNLKPRHNILFAYILDKNSNKLSYINALATEKNLKVIIKYETGTPEDTVEEWLALFRDADYIITDSFHGTVFSLIFNKQFTIFKNQYRGNIRIDSLVRQMQLEPFCIEQNEEYLCYKPDWQQINSNIQRWRKIGSDFLISSLHK